MLEKEIFNFKSALPLEPIADKRHKRMENAKHSAG
jgi:hypothetical protein